MISLWTLFLSVLTLSLAKSSTGDSVLVILDPNLQKDNFSIFFNNLKGMNGIHLATHIHPFF